MCDDLMNACQINSTAVVSEGSTAMQRKHQQLLGSDVTLQHIKEALSLIERI